LQTSVDKQVQLMMENAKKSTDLKNKSGGGRRQLSR